MSSILQRATRATMPLDFNLFNDQDLTTLYITDDAAGQKLRLELTNTAGEQLELVQPAGLPGLDDLLSLAPTRMQSPDRVIIPTRGNSFNFELVFRPDVLVISDDLLKKIKVAETNIACSTSKNLNGSVSIVLTVPPQKLDAGAKLTITLLNLVVNGRLGSRGTRVMLRYYNIKLHGGSYPISGYRETHLSLVNHLGKQNIPLYADIVGSAKVLNNGQTLKDPLVLRLSNTSKATNIIGNATDPKSMLYISFAAGDPDKEWALAKADQLKGITITDGSGVQAQRDDSGIAPVWSLAFAGIPASHKNNPPDPNKDIPGYIDIYLNGITTSHPAGTTIMQIRYENIPGYWDGFLSTVLEKAPLVYKQSRVGIGTADPEATLHANGGNNDMLTLKLESNSNLGSWMRLQNNSTGGLSWNIISAGMNNGEGAGNLLFKQGDGGPVRLLLTKEGKFGLGTSAPSSMLHVKSSEANVLNVESTYTSGTWFQLGNTSGSGQAWNLVTTGSSNGEGAGNLLFYQSNGGTVRLILTKEGRLGLGTSYPDSTLHVKSSDKSVADIESNHNEGTGLKLRNTSTGGKSWNIISMGGNSDDNTGSLIFSQDDYAGIRMILHSGGNVGIGAFRPYEKLEVGEYGSSANTFIAVKSGTQAQTGIKLRNGSEDSGYDIISNSNVLRINSRKAQDTQIRMSAGNYAMQLVLEADTDGSGNDLSMLTVLKSAGRNKGQLGFLTPNSGSFEMQNTIQLPNGTPGTASVIIDSDGSTRITNSNTVFKVQADGNVCVYPPGGSTAKWAAGTYVSDIRLKTDIEPIASPLQRLSAMQGISFRWKDEVFGKERELGLIAQEVRQIFPELMYHFTDQETMMVQYEKFVPVLIEAMKEQQKMIETMREDLNSFTRQTNGLA